MNRRIKTFLILVAYIVVTVGAYYGVCYFREIPFTDLHLLYGALIGCIAYLPRFIAERKADKKR